MVGIVQQIRELWASGDNRAVVALLGTHGLENGMCPGDRAMLMYYRGNAQYKLGDIRAGVRELRAAYDLIDHVESPADACWLTIGYAVALGKRGDHERAASLLADAEPRFRPSGIQAAYLKWHLGWQAAKAGDRRGIDYIRQAIDLLGPTVDRWWASLDLAQCILEAGDAREALCLLDSVSTVRDQRPATWRVRYDYTRAEALLECGMVTEAEEAVMFAAASSEEVPNDEERARVLLLAARIAQHTGGAADRLAQMAMDHAVRARNGVLASEALAINGIGR